MNQSCNCQPTPQPQQRWIQAVSATYTTAHGRARSFNSLSEVRDQTCILTGPSQVLIHGAITGTPKRSTFKSVVKLGCSPQEVDISRAELIFLLFFFFFCLFAVSWAAAAAHGGSQARGRIRAVATGPCQSHSNVGSEPCLHPTPQLTAMPDR